jgi:4-aminobutyrate aminotransferase/(S)-3-amino-2-methylpropionate transaminase
MERDRLADRSLEIGKKVVDRYKGLQEKYPVIGDVRGMGGMVGIEFVADIQTKEPDAALTSEIINLCAAKGLLVEGAGTFHNVIRFLAPLVMTNEQLEAGLAIFEEAVAEASAKKS